MVVLADPGIATLGGDESGLLRVRSPVRDEVIHGGTYVEERIEKEGIEGEGNDHAPSRELSRRAHRGPVGVSRSSMPAD
jgi:hypothetical protein